MNDNQILESALRQAELEVAKATFFMSGGQVIELDPFEYKPRPPHHEPEKKVVAVKKPWVPRHSKAEEAERDRKRAIRQDRERKLVERIEALRDVGLTRNETAAQIGTSYNGLTKIIERNGIVFPKCYEKRKTYSE